MDILEEFKKELGPADYEYLKGKIPRTEEFARNFLWGNGVEDENVQKLFEALDKAGFWGPEYIPTEPQRRIVHPELFEEHEFDF